RRILRERGADRSDPLARRGAGHGDGAGHPPDVRGSLPPGAAHAGGLAERHGVFARTTVMRAMILAAGFGTRMRPLTYTLPKLLVPVCNRPLIGWAVETFLRAGVRDLIVNLHHFPEMIEQHLLAAYEADFHFSFEAEILGTGGGIKRVRTLLESDEDFIAVNGDTIQFPDYAALRNARRKQDALASLLLRHPPAGDRFTPVWSDNGEITGFGKGHGEALMFSGAHCLSSRVLGIVPDGFSG